MAITIIICLSLIIIVGIICFTSYKMRNVKQTEEFLRVLEYKVKNTERSLAWIEESVSAILNFLQPEKNCKQ